MQTKRKTRALKYILKYKNKKRRKFIVILKIHSFSVPWDSFAKVFLVLTQLLQTNFEPIQGAFCHLLLACCGYVQLGQSKWGHVANVAFIRGQ